MPDIKIELALKQWDVIHVMSLKRYIRNLLRGFHIGLIDNGLSSPIFSALRQSFGNCGVIWY